MNKGFGNFLVHAGFTLTELMAVVIIVAILAGIGFGSYKKSVERSHFSEGLVAGSTVLEAVNRYYYDNPDDSSRTQPRISYLDIDMANAKACAVASNYCFKTRYFEITVNSSGVQVDRVQGPTKKDYYLKLYPDFSSSRSQDNCIGRNDTGKELCQSMGYTSCASYTCSKP